MFLESDTTLAGNIAAVADELVRQGRTSEAVDVVYQALAQVGYPYRAMAEVAVKKFSSRRMAAIAETSAAAQLSDEPAMTCQVNAA
jgi:hypothetical protein